MLHKHPYPQCNGCSHYDKCTIKVSGPEQELIVIEIEHNMESALACLRRDSETLSDNDEIVKEGYKYVEAPEGNVIIVKDRNKDKEDV